MSANWRSLAASDTGRAAGMALAVVASNGIGLVFTVVFARILGASDYGSLAVLVSAWIILMVPGSALQVAVARRVSRARESDEAGAGARRWLGRLLFAAAAVGILAIPFRELLATLLNVDEDWAAAAVPLTGMLWAVLCVERGALQGFGEYRSVALSVIGETGARLVFALALVALGLDVTGAFVGTTLSLVATGLVLARPVLRRVPHAPHRVSPTGLRTLVTSASTPMLGLSLLFALQEIHVIVVKHEAGSEAAGAYAVAAVAAKAIIWVAIGLGLFLVPEAARRAQASEDARPILVRALALIVALAVPALLIFVLASEPLLSVAFGDDLTGAAGSLPWLGLAMALLACTYLCVQFLLALQRTSFIVILGVALVVEVFAVARAGSDLESVAVSLCVVQAALAAVFLGVAFRGRVRQLDEVPA